jgi:LL-diaminopimelate aminotransferase
MKINPSDRIAFIKPYFFSTLSKKINDLKSIGVDIIRIDIGSPDLPPQKFIIDRLSESANESNTHGYTSNGGTPAYRNAITAYYKKRFGVDLDPNTETVGLIGSKEGLFHLTQVLINPGDLVLVPDPGYPVYSASTLIAGGEVYSLPLIKENNFLPDLDKLPANIVNKAKLMWINYPNNPTGAVASKEFLEKIIKFGFKNNIIIAHDAPYVDVCFDGYIAPSIMQIPEAKNIAIEFNSLSKTYNMAGWRLGMAVGNPDLIRFINTYKSQLDSSHFDPILEAGIAALTGDQSWLASRNQIYKNRRDIVVDGLKSLGFEVDSPPAAIYIWAKLPTGFEDSIDFCDHLLEDTGVSVTPGIVYGTFGEGYIRVSLGTNSDKLSEAIVRIKNWFLKKGQ